jgi:hypothetical protein
MDFFVRILLWISCCQFIINVVEHLFISIVEKNVMVYGYTLYFEESIKVYSL